MNPYRSLIDSSRLAEILHRAGLGGKISGGLEGKASFPLKVRFSEPTSVGYPLDEKTPLPLTAPEARPQVQTFEPAEYGSLAERFEGLLEWAIDTARGETAFVADDDGLAMVDLGESEGMMSLSAVLGRVLSRASASVPEVVPSSIGLEIQNGKHLQLVWAEGTQGRFALGILGTDRLTIDIVDEIRNQLRRASGE